MANGIVVVGDAASLCDPFLAEGLRPGPDEWLRSRTASQPMDQRARVNDLRGYSRSHARALGRIDGLGAAHFAGVLSLPAVWGISWGSNDRQHHGESPRSLSGEMGYGDIAQRVIKRLLLQRN